MKRILTSAVIANAHSDVLKTLDGRQMEYGDIIGKFETLGDSKAAEGMAKYGITGSKVYGIKIPVIRDLAKKAGKRNRELAAKLWKQGSREARILASMVDDHTRVTGKQMERWVSDFDSWEVCDQCIMNLFEKTSFAWDKAYAWSERDEEFVKRAGFVMMARLAVSDKKADDRLFEPFLPIIKREAHDGRNFVKKAVNWALRQIGKRSAFLHPKALETAREILGMEAKNAKWVAGDAIRELESGAVLKKVGIFS